MKRPYFISTIEKYVIFFFLNEYHNSKLNFLQITQAKQPHVSYSLDRSFCVV